MSGLGDLFCAGAIVALAVAAFLWLMAAMWEGHAADEMAARIESTLRNAPEGDRKDDRRDDG